jgi:hypothetical protein
MKAMTSEPTAWAHLPNATHIDRVLAHAKQHPDRWGAAWDAAQDAARAAALDAALDAARDAARDAAMDAARDAAMDAAWDAAWDAARYAAQDAALGAALDAARGACYALVAWDDCAPVLDMPADAVRLLAAVGHHPAVLLLPAVLAFEGETNERNRT